MHTASSRNNKRLFNESRKSCQIFQHESQIAFCHSVLHIVRHECSSAESFNLILMFKTCVANKPSVCYITKANVNEAVWYLFETENSSSVNDNVTRSRLWQSSGTVRWVERLWVEKHRAGCHLLGFYEAQSDNLLHTIRWINRPPTSCSAHLSEHQPGLMIYSLPSTVTLNLFGLRLPKGSDVFFSRPLAAAVKMHNGELWQLTMILCFRCFTWFIVGRSPEAANSHLFTGDKIFITQAKNVVSNVDVGVLVLQWAQEGSTERLHREAVSGGEVL